LYNKGVALNKQYFNEDGTPQPDTSKANSSAVLAKGGLNGWKKYLQRNLHWPSGLRFSTGTLATVGVDFVVNEEGKIEDAEVSVPFHPEFDKIALRIIKESPAWIPAVWHNRKVKSWHRQPVTFEQEE
jgi:outer membrane biosynthesis protein TonB